MIFGKRLRSTAALTLGVAAVGFWVDNPYTLQLLIVIGIHTLLALGLNMLMGYAGQISLGHAAFFGLGAYGSGILTTHFQWSPLAALPVLLAAACLVGYHIGRPALRLSGYYQAMGTLGLGIIAHVIFREWDTYTGGASRLVGIPPLVVGSIVVALRRSGFYAVWATVVLCFIVCGRVVDSRVGSALRGLGDSEGAAAPCGIHAAHLKAVWKKPFSAMKSRNWNTLCAKPPLNCGRNSEFPWKCASWMAQASALQRRFTIENHPQCSESRSFRCSNGRPPVPGPGITRLPSVP